VTDHEKKQQRVSLGIEIEDAKEEFVHLRERALQRADRLDEITKKIRTNANYRPSPADFTPDFEMANRLRPEHQAVLNFDEIGKLIEELRAERKKLYNLYERKNQLSNVDGSMTV